MNWILDNKEWLFSGIGVLVVAGLIAVLRRSRAKGGENHPGLAVHTQNINLIARDFHEEYDHALGVFIANTGNSPIHIHRALFRNRVPFALFLRRTSKLPVYPKAFKDTEQDAFELKFGEQWYDPQTDIDPRGRVMTYLPLSREVPDADCNGGRHGEVVLRYSSDGKAGTHRVRV